MLSLVQLNDRILDYQYAMIPQSVEYCQIHRAKVDVLYWLKNGGELRTDEEINTKIERYKEELLAYTDPHDIQHKIRLARIRELEEVRDAE